MRAECDGQHQSQPRRGSGQAGLLARGEEAAHCLHQLVLHRQRARHQVRSRLEYCQLCQEDGDGEWGGAQIGSVQHPDQRQNYGLVYEDQPQRGGENLQGIRFPLSLQGILAVLQVISEERVDIWIFVIDIPFLGRGV